jgi:cell division protein FtsB
MAENRRTPPRGAGPRGRTGPGRTPSSRRHPRLPAASPGGPEKPRSRLTGRAAILVLVVAVLTVSYASSMRAFLQQRSHINTLKTQIADREASIEALESEKRRWDDPAYVEQQARQRLGYVMPGERTYLVLDQNGQPLQPESSLADPDEVITTTPTAWYDDAWASVELAGHPPKPAKPPLTEIDGSNEKTGD